MYINPFNPFNPLFIIIQVLVIVAYFIMNFLPFWR